MASNVASSLKAMGTESLHACTPPMACVYFKRSSYQKNRLGIKPVLDKVSFLILCVRFYSMSILPADLTSHFLLVSSRARNHLPFCRCMHLQFRPLRFFCQALRQSSHHSANMELAVSTVICYKKYFLFQFLEVCNLYQMVCTLYSVAIEA